MKVIEIRKGSIGIKVKEWYTRKQIKKMRQNKIIIPIIKNRSETIKFIPIGLMKSNVSMIDICKKFGIYFRDNGVMDKLTILKQELSYEDNCKMKLKYT